MTNVFVALGQNHITNFEKLINNNLIKKGENILLAGSNVIVNEDLWDEIYLSSLSFNNSATNILNQFTSIFIKIKAYSNLIKNVRNLKNKEVTAYVSYIEDVLSNYVFFSLSNKQSVVIVEDGTLNYYNHSLKNISKIKFYLKKVIAFFFSINFKKYKGHSSGAEYSFVKTQFLTFPKNAFIKKNALQLPIHKETLQNVKQHIYIIGQESYGTIIGQNIYENVVSEFFSKIKSHEFYKEIDKIFYKPHRNGKQFSYDYLKNIFSEKEFILLNSKKTSEDIYFQELNCKYIMTLDSSTVINIYSRINEADKKKVSFFVYPKLNTNLGKMFSNLKFNFLK